MTQALAFAEMESAGFVDLSHDEMVKLNGGGWWDVVKTFVKGEFAGPAVLAMMIADFLMHPEDAITDFLEGWSEFISE